MIFRTEILDAIDVTVSFVVVDLESGEIVAASQACERMFGYLVVGELAGRNVDILVPTALRPSHVQHRREYAANPLPRGMNLQGQRRDGSVFPVRINLSAAMIGLKRCAIAVIVSLDELKGDAK